MCFITSSKMTEKENKTPTAPSVPAHLCEPSTSHAVQIPSRRGQDTGCGFIAPKAFMEEKLSVEVNQYADNSHRAKLEAAEKTVKAVLTATFPGIRVWTTGSLPAGVDLPGSDVDMTVKMPDEVTGTQFQKLLRMKFALREMSEFSEAYVVRARVPVLQLRTKGTNGTSGTRVDVTIDNEDGKRNTQLLVWYGQIDTRFPLLCRAVKDWASSVGVLGAANGRLNSFTLCMMLISFLQSCKVLPSLQECCEGLDSPIEVPNDDYQKRNVRKELEASGHRFEQNKSPIGCLFAGFLKHYAEFDFHSNWISIRRGKVLPKRLDADQKPLDGMPSNSRLVCIEDPFIEPAWNCGGSVFDSQILERLQSEFQQSYARLLSSRSIFGHLQSVARRNIEAEGRKRDLSVETWKVEIIEARRKIWDWSLIEEGTGTPFEGILPPDFYWDKPKEPKSIVEPWPVVFRFNYDDF